MRDGKMILLHMDNFELTKSLQLKHLIRNHHPNGTLSKKTSPAADWSSILQTPPATPIQHCLTTMGHEQSGDARPTPTAIRAQRQSSIQRNRQNVQ
jgi:hypothetical protein